MCIVQLNMVYLELISSARDNVTLRSAMTYKIDTSLTTFCCLQIFSNIQKQLGKQSQPLHHNEIKYQGEAIPILCAVGAHEPHFLALQISNAVSQKLDSNEL